MSEKFWAVSIMRNDTHYIEADSIGDKTWAENHRDNNILTPFPMSVKVITRKEAIDIITEDILDHDKLGLKLNAAEAAATRKLYWRLNKKENDTND